jgi:hypothetical protein
MSRPGIPNDFPHGLLHGIMGDEEPGAFTDSDDNDSTRVVIIL